MVKKSKEKLGEVNNIEVFRYTLENKELKVNILNLGCIIEAIYYKPYTKNLVLNYSYFEEYLIDDINLCKINPISDDVYKIRDIKNGIELEINKNLYISKDEYVKVTKYIQYELDENKLIIRKYGVVDKDIELNIYNNIYFKLDDECNILNYEVLGEDIHQYLKEDYIDKTFKVELDNKNILNKELQYGINVLSKKSNIELKIYTNNEAININSSNIENNQNFKDYNSSKNLALLITTFNLDKQLIKPSRPYYSSTVYEFNNII